MNLCVGHPAGIAVAWLVFRHIVELGVAAAIDGDRIEDEGRIPSPVERASMNELAKRLGGSKATLYGYFPSKEELFVAVVQNVATSHLAATPLELLEVNGDATLESLLTSFCERMLPVLSNDAKALAVYRMVIAEAGHSNVGSCSTRRGRPSSSRRSPGSWRPPWDTASCGAQIRS